MNWNKWMRQGHRWLSLLFTLLVLVVTFAVLRQNEPAEWVYFLPLIPLFLLMISGLYLFGLPYATKWRNLKNR